MCFMFCMIYISLHSRLSKQCNFQNLSKLDVSWGPLGKPSTSVTPLFSTGGCCCSSFNFFVVVGGSSTTRVFLSLPTGKCGKPSSLEASLSSSLASLLPRAFLLLGLKPVRDFSSNHYLHNII